MKTKVLHSLFLLSIIIFTLLSFKRIIYKRGKTYIYDAFYIKANGDTLTKETIELKPKGRPWLFQFSQTAYKIIYYPKTDSLFDWVHPVNYRRKYNEKSKSTAITNGIKWHYPVTTNTSSGAVENNSELWTHPFRSNQYINTEIAPFPEIDKNKLYKDSVWHSGLILGYDNWKGQINYEYIVLGKKDYEYGGLVLKECWEINASGEHSNPEYGVSWNHFLYHPKNGFIELNYTFYNGVRIDFKLINVIDKH